MNTRRALAVVVLAVGVVALFLLRHPSKSRTAPLETVQAAQSADSPSPGPRPSGHTAEGPRTELPAAPSRERIANDPDGAAHAWHARASANIAARDRRQFGGEIGRLMQLPYAQAWDPLVEKANDGDVAAAAAAMMIASACNAEATVLDAPHHGTKPSPSAFFRDLPDDWKPFVDRIAAAEDATHAVRIADCSRIGGFTDLALLFLDRFIRADSIDVQVEMAGEDDDPHRAIADLRAILAEHENRRGRQLLGERLLQSTDPAQRAEGLAILEPLAADDGSIARAIGECLALGCGGAARDPVAARPWLERSAGLGDPIGATRLSEVLVASGEKPAAWAWSLYRLDLAVNGCLEFFTPSYTTVAAAAQDEARHRAALSPAEQNAGLAMNYAIAGRWEKKAKDALACAD